MSEPTDATGWIAWANANPDQAVAQLPEVEKYLRWRQAPFYPVSSPTEGQPRTGRRPFITTEGREIA